MKSYVPENPDDYAMDFHLQPGEDGLRATLVIIKKDLLASIRERYPEAALRIPSDDSGPRDDLYFRPNRGNSSVKKIGAALLAVLPFAAFLAWTVAAKNDTLGALAAASAADSMRSRTADTARLEDDRDALQREWNALVAARPVNLASFFDILAQEAPAMEIRTLAVEGRNFDIRGLSADPISILKALSESPFFSDVRVSDIRPLPNTSRSEFTLRGIYRGP